MVPRKFEYFAPTTLRDATSLLKKYGSDAKLLAGGMSLIPVMKLRLGSPPYIIDLNRIPGLEYIKRSGGSIVIGAMTRHHAVETSKVAGNLAPILCETAAWIGDAQVRNMGTIGGSLSHCDPSGDWGAALVALRGRVKLKGPSKERTLEIDDFLVDTFTSALKDDEILTEIAVPVPAARSGGAYVKLERRTGDFATVAVAVQVSLDAKGACSYAGIGLTALGSKNLRASKAEAELLGKPLTAKVIEAASEAASEDAQPMPDPLRGSAEYKKEMAKVYTRRGLDLAVQRAKRGK
ncbi:MAG: xanthine dehydrogenase family protein subunit M [Thaumarchaeota archaeon]|nr:xanthine dehydrogenase family protein subunit M [Nitrososphaerota archaeon]